MNLGLILLLIGTAITFIAPIERTLMHRRWARHDVVLPPLDIAFPIERADPDIGALTDAAEHALEQDALQRGVVAVARTYDAATRG